MKPKERVLSAVEHRETDRVPVTINLTPEINRALTEYFDGADVNQVLSIDFRSVGPRSLKKLKPSDPTRGINSYDIWGVPYHRVEHASGGAYDETVDFVLNKLASQDDVNNYPWPSPDDFDFSDIADQAESCRDYAVVFGNPGIPDIINGVGRGRTMQQVLVDIALNDEIGLAIIDRRVDFYYEYCRRALEAGHGKIDILALGEDLGTERGSVVSLEMFNRIFRPRLGKFFDLAHRYGAKVMMHSCGSTRNLIPSLIDMGLDILDAVQPEPEGMDPAELKQLFGNKLTFCGMISTQKTLPFGSEEECRREARHRIEVIGKNGGYIFAPAHAVQPDTPLRNILAVYEEALGRNLLR